jgi:hypothetical protein
MDGMNLCGGLKKKTKGRQEIIPKTGKDAIMNEALKNLKLASQLIGDAKVIVMHNVEVARLLMDESQLHELQNFALKSGSDIATIEGGLSEFERLGFGNKRFAINKN